MFYHLQGEEIIKRNKIERMLNNERLQIIRDLLHCISYEDNKDPFYYTRYDPPNIGAEIDENGNFILLQTDCETYIQEHEDPYYTFYIEYEIDGCFVYDNPEDYNRGKWVDCYDVKIKYTSAHDTATELFCSYNLEPNNIVTRLNHFKSIDVVYTYDGIKEFKEQIKKNEMIENLSNIFCEDITVDIGKYLYI